MTEVAPAAHGRFERSGETAHEVALKRDGVVIRAAADRSVPIADLHEALDEIVLMDYAVYRSLLATRTVERTF